MGNRKIAEKRTKVSKISEKFAREGRFKLFKRIILEMSMPPPHFWRFLSAMV